MRGHTKSWFDGAVTETLEFEGRGWTDTWHGPGGRLIVTRLNPSAPARFIDIDRKTRVDHLETLYRPDGTTVQYVGTEGATYKALPELMGVHWKEYSRRSA